MKKLLSSFLLTFVASMAGANTTVEKRVVSQPLNHANASLGAYKQNIEIFIPEGVSKTSPVIFFVGGEGGPSKIEKLAAPFMKEHKAIYIQADHRGYGSYSSDVDQSIPTYVKSKEAIEDFHEDIQLLKKEFPGPWVLYGTSYSGTLAIEISAKYPADANVVVSSSGIETFGFVSNAHDQLMQSEWPAGLYTKMSTRIENLKPVKPYDQAWKERLFLQYAFIGSVQYKRFAVIPKILEAMSFLSTKDLIDFIGMIDHMTGSLASNWSSSQATKTLDLSSAQTLKYHGRFWEYQQCNEFGTFWISDSTSKIFPQSADEYADNCFAMFGIKPSISRKWDIKSEVANLKVPLIYVTGKKDPWFSIEPQPTDLLPTDSEYILADEGYHCPDREDSSIAKKMVQSVWQRLH